MLSVNQIMNVKKAFTAFLIHQQIQIIVNVKEIDIGISPTTIVVSIYKNQRFSFLNLIFKLTLRN